MPIKLPRIRHWIKGWRLDKFFNKAFKDLDEEAKVLLPVIIEMTNKLKEFVESPVADVVTAIIPGTLDNMLREKLKAKLPAALMKLQLIRVINNSTDDVNEQLKAVLGILKLAPDETKDRFYHEFSFTFLEAMSDGKLTMGEAGVLVQMYYDYKHQKAA